MSSPAAESSAVNPTNMNKKQQQQQQQQQRRTMVFHNLLHEELGIRKSVQTSVGAQGKQGNFMHVIGAAMVNLLLALLIFVLFLFSLESLLSIALCIKLTIYTYHVAQNEVSLIDGTVMSWTSLTFAVVTPLSASIGMAFTRREGKSVFNLCSS